MDLKLDSTTKDLVLNSVNDLDIVTDTTGNPDSIAQHIMQRIKLFYGEWFLDTSAGVPYYQSVFKKNPSQQIITGVFQQAIIQSPGVEELLSFELDFTSETRELSLIFSVRTTDGVIEFNETVGA